MTAKKKVEAPVVEETQAQKKEQKAMDFRQMIVQSLTKTGRDNIEALIKFMDEIGFFTAPCSGGNHLANESGLAEHSCNVMFTAEKFSVSLYGGKNITDELRNSIVIAALLHDLGKCGDYGKQMYVANILKSGKASEAKPFKRNPDLSAVPHAVRSVKLATLFIDLTEDEEWAILCHDGLYDFMKYDMNGKETPLQMLIHWADMWSSRVVESGSDETAGRGEEL